MHWYLPAVEARPTTPRHRPRPRQTVAQIEAMYHGGTPMASLRLSTRLWRVRQLQPNTPVAPGFYVNTARAGPVITRRHQPRILPAVG